METIFRKVSVKERLPSIPIKFYVTYLENSNDEFIFEWRGHWNDDGSEVNHVTHWLEEIPLPEIIQEKDRIIERASKDYSDLQNQNIAKLEQIKELKEDVIEFVNYISENDYQAQFVLEPKWISIYDQNQTRISTKQLYSKYLSTRK